MKKRFFAIALLALILIPATIMPSPSVYPTGTTIYKPDKCWNGYNIPSIDLVPSKAQLFDMNGNVVHEWEGIIGSPYRILPGGYIMGAVDQIAFDRTPLVQLDWDGNVVWKFEKSELVTKERVIRWDITFPAWIHPLIGETPSSILSRTWKGRISLRLSYVIRA
jgi:hypothetical protein